MGPRRVSRARAVQAGVQITGALHGVGWKLVLGIEGGAQGNCYTANGFTFACLPPALTLLPPAPSFLTLYTTRSPPLFLPSSLLLRIYSFLHRPHRGNQFPPDYSSLLIL